MACRICSEFVEHEHVGFFLINPTLLLCFVVHFKSKETGETPLGVLPPTRCSVGSPHCAPDSKWVRRHMSHAMNEWGGHKYFCRQVTVYTYIYICIGIYIYIICLKLHSVCVSWISTVLCTRSLCVDSQCISVQCDNVSKGADTF